MSAEATFLALLVAFGLLALFMLVVSAPRREARRRLRESRREAVAVHRESAEERAARAQAAERERTRAELEAIEAEEAMRTARMKAKAAAERAEVERAGVAFHRLRAQRHEHAEADDELEVPRPRNPGDRHLRSERDALIGDDGTDADRRTGRFSRDAPVPRPEADKARAGRTLGS